MKPGHYDGGPRAVLRVFYRFYNQGITTMGVLLLMIQILHYLN